jgi:hypothetical protein
MGVSTNFYTVYGVKLDWHDELHAAYDEVYDHSDTPNIIADGMGGDYIILGTVLYDSGDARYGFDGGDQMKEIDLDSLAGLAAEYREQFTAKFPQFAALVATPFKLIAFAHYS